jgi:3-phenylpropionate/trans-cinnamate dioxygenase ferredoxin reductase component
VPYFWSDQLGHVVQFAGYHRDADQVVHRGDPAGAHGWTLCWLREGRLVGVLAVDRRRDLLQGRRAIAEGRTPDPDRLADPDVQLKSA